MQMFFNKSGSGSFIRVPHFHVTDLPGCLNPQMTQVLHASKRLSEAFKKSKCVDSKMSPNELSNVVVHSSGD